MCLSQPVNPYIKKHSFLHIPICSCACHNMWVHLSKWHGARRDKHGQGGTNMLSEKPKTWWTLRRDKTWARWEPTCFQKTKAWGTLILGITIWQADFDKDESNLAMLAKWMPGRLMSLLSSAQWPWNTWPRRTETKTMEPSYLQWSDRFLLPCASGRPGGQVNTWSARSDGVWGWAEAPRKNSQSQAGHQADGYWQRWSCREWWPCREWCCCREWCSPICNLFCDIDWFRCRRSRWWRSRWWWWWWWWCSSTHWSPCTDFKAPKSVWAGWEEHQDQHHATLLLQWPKAILMPVVWVQWPAFSLWTRSHLKPQWRLQEFATNVLWFQAPKAMQWSIGKTAHWPQECPTSSLIRWHLSRQQPTT